MENDTARVSGARNEASALRRTPNQRRSRERVEKILTCATTLIAKSGSDALRMSDVARLSGISIGSLYQYFPDKGAIVQTLAERYNAEGRACIKAALDPVGTADDLIEAFGGLVDAYYQIFLAEPVMREIWSGTQANKALNDIELADSRLNGAILADALRRLNGTADEAERAAAAFLIMHMGEATMRLAISVPRAEGEEMVGAYKRMALTELRRIAGDRAA